MDYFHILQGAAEAAEASPYVIDLHITRLGVRVSGRRLVEGRHGGPVNALRYDRHVGWNEAALAGSRNMLLEAIRAVEEGLKR